MRGSTLFEAVGGADSVLRLAHAWHQRVMADEIVAHAFSHGFHPKPPSGWRTIGVSMGWTNRLQSAVWHVRLPCSDDSGNGLHEEMVVAPSSASTAHRRCGGLGNGATSRTCSLLLFAGPRPSRWPRTRERG